MSERDDNGNALFPSRFEIGEKVQFHIHGGENDGVSIIAYVRAVTFTVSKVRYSLLILATDPPDSFRINEDEEDGMGSTIHNVDSNLVFPIDGEREVLELGFDNYS